MSSRAVVDVPCLSLQRKQAAAALGISGDHFDRHVRPELPCVYVGRVRLWRVADLDRWLAKQTEQPLGSSVTTENAPAAQKRPGARHRRH